MQLTFAAGKGARRVPNRMEIAHDTPRLLADLLDVRGFRPHGRDAVNMDVQKADLVAQVAALPNSRLKRRKSVSRRSRRSSCRAPAGN